MERAISMAKIRLAIRLLFLTALMAAPVRAQSDRYPVGGMISDIRFVGNDTIGAEKIRAVLQSKVNHPLDQKTVDADIQSLYKKKWFTNVYSYFEESPPKSGKYILTFEFREMPILTHVEFRGLSKIKRKEIEQITDLRVGGRADASRTAISVGQIRNLYHEKGYDLAEVELIEGGKLNDRRVVMQIFEGPKFQISSIKFVGNTFVTHPVLRTKITSRIPILGLGGKYHSDMLEEDARKLREYYQAQGFFQVMVTPITKPLSNPGDIELTFYVSEGVRYSVRELIFEGNEKIPVDKLKEGLELHSGKPFLDGLREADRNRLMTKYYELGCIDTQIAIEPRYTNKLGVVDLVYKIEEGEPYILGDLVIRGNDRTQDKVIRREAWMAGLVPGEVLNKNRMDLFQTRLRNLQYFHATNEMGKAIDLKIVNRRPKDKPYGDIILPLGGDVVQARMQDQDPGGPDELPPPLPTPEPRLGAPGSSGPPGLMPFGSNNLFSPPPDSAPAFDPPVAPGLVPGRGPRGGAPMVGPRPPGTPPVGTGEPPGTFPSIPGMNVNDTSPDRNDPFPNRAFADIVTSVDEAPTGRFMLGVAASSFQGIFGNLSIYEKNFNLFNPPRSFSDITNGKAFRGGGQEFQIMLQPGTLINSFQISLRDPYLFDLPIGAGARGYLFSRIYPDWTERRGGGRFTLGRQFGTSLYADVAVRAEAVDFFGYRTPTPADYLAVSGTTDVFSLRPSLRYDNRNSPFMATKGQYAEVAFEQGWGTFTFAKFDAEGRMYLPTGSRPDGSGKRFFTLRGHFGIATEETPVYERYFAGNFGSLRGFQYRGVGPRVLGQNVGGFMMAVGSLEYQFPWTASDSLHQVFFTDFGTVEPNYSFNNIRVSVGTGLRVVIPQFGPVPLGFDLAFPVIHAAGDRLSYFNFSMSAMY
jgi:outer membrane protein insertion porin family